MMYVENVRKKSNETIIDINVNGKKITCIASAEWIESSNVVNGKDAILKLSNIENSYEEYFKVGTWFVKKGNLSKKELVEHILNINKGVEFLYISAFVMNFFRNSFIEDCANGLYANATLNRHLKNGMSMLGIENIAEWLRKECMDGVSGNENIVRTADGFNLFKTLLDNLLNLERGPVCAYEAKKRNFVFISCGEKKSNIELMSLVEHHACMAINTVMFHGFVGNKGIAMREVDVMTHGEIVPLSEKMRMELPSIAEFICLVVDKYKGKENPMSEYVIDAVYRNGKKRVTRKKSKMNIGSTRILDTRYVSAF